MPHSGPNYKLLTCPNPPNHSPHRSSTMWAAPLRVPTFLHHPLASLLAAAPFDLRDTIVSLSFAAFGIFFHTLRGSYSALHIAPRRARDRLPPGEARRGRPFTSFASTSSDPRRCPRHFTDFPPPPISTMLRTAQDKQTPRDGRYFGVTPSVSVHPAPCKRNDGHRAS